MKDSFDFVKQLISKNLFSTYQGKREMRFKEIQSARATNKAVMKKCSSCTCKKCEFENGMSLDHVLCVNVYSRATVITQIRTRVGGLLWVWMDVV